MKTNNASYLCGQAPRWLSGLLIIVSGALVACGGSPAAQYDVLIVGGTVYDGSNTAPREVNIGVLGDRIVSMDAAADANAVLRINAAGHVVVPGFVDPHTHALSDLLDPAANSNLNYLMQGVTTVVVGNDGGGVPDLDESLSTLREQGVGTNVAFFAGHGDIRETVMGLENRASTADELQAMRDITEAQMQAGALGLSTGLYYTPGSYAETTEVVELAKVAAGFGGIYDSHMRDESSYSIGLLGSIREVIEVAEQADIPVHIAHLKALGRDVWGQSGDLIALIEAARERGLDVTADQYPYQASGTRFRAALIPAWVRADSSDAMFSRIANADLADGIREEMEANLWRRGGAESMLVTGEGSEWQGQTLAEIAAALNVSPVEAAVEVVRGGDPSIASFNMMTDDIHAIALQDWVMTGSDGSAGHPRKFATYPTVYRDMVLEAKLFPIERFIHRSSGLVADTLRLCDRGYLRLGRRADIVVLDLENYRAVADFQNPTALSSGVVHALVNGQSAVRDSALVEALPGEVINRQALSCTDD